MKLIKLCRIYRNKLSLLILLIGVLCFLSWKFSFAASGVPTILSYQGRLTNGSGDLLGGSGTTFYFKFSIWDNPTSSPETGTRLWPSSAPTSVALTVRSGVFTAHIGDTANSYPDVLDYNFNTNQDIYLQIQVSSDNSTFETLSPRRRIAASSFSQLAGAISGTTTPSMFGTTTPIGSS